MHIGRAIRLPRDLDVMRDELSHALVEALFEIETLPVSADGAVVGLYAIMDDLRDAIDRTEELDLHRSA